MIYGVGTDIIEVKRVKKQLDKISGLKEKLYTPLEIAYCESQKYTEQHFAARFAAKEAFLKALGTGWRNGLAYNEIEVFNNKLGKPEIKLYGKSQEFADKEHINSIHISISHINNIANAMVILES
ncbi:MAG: holo-ACP synthase [Bacteroidota bacterium]